jgi:hypothetical protein
MATTPGGHLNPQGLTPGVGPYFDPSKPSAKQKYAYSQIQREQAHDARLKARDATDAHSKEMREKYAAIAAESWPKPGIPGVPQSPMYSMQMPAPKKPGLFKRLHTAVSTRQFGRRK